MPRETSAWIGSPGWGRGTVPTSGRTARDARCRAGRPARHRRRRRSRSCLATSSSATAAIGASRPRSDPDGTLGGIEPRDAVVRFDIGLGDRVKPRILPTNVVCIYAPRFAEVRVTTGTNETVDVQGPRSGISIETPLLARNLAEARRVVQNQSPELARNRLRASGLQGTGVDR